MDIMLDTTESKRLDLCLEWKDQYQIKGRKFVVRHGNKTRVFDTLLDAVDYYSGLPNEPLFKETVEPRPLHEMPTWCYTCDRWIKDCACVENEGTY